MMIFYYLEPIRYQAKLGWGHFIATLLSNKSAKLHYFRREIKNAPSLEQVRGNRVCSAMKPALTPGGTTKNYASTESEKSKLLSKEAAPNKVVDTINAPETKPKMPVTKNRPVAISFNLFDSFISFPLIHLKFLKLGTV